MCQKLSPKKLFPIAKWQNPGPASSRIILKIPFGLWRKRTVSPVGLSSTPWIKNIPIGLKNWIRRVMHFGGKLPYFRSESFDMLPRFIYPPQLSNLLHKASPLSLTPRVGYQDSREVRLPVSFQPINFISAGKQGGDSIRWMIMLYFGKRNAVNKKGRANCPCLFW